MKKLLSMFLIALLCTVMAACDKPTGIVGSQQSDTNASKERFSTIENAIQSVLEDKVPVSISFWTGTGAANYPILEAMVDEFQKKYPNITVDFSNQGPITELTDKLTQNIVSKTTPTLSNLSPTSFLEYIDAGAIIDLAPYFNDAAVGYSSEEQKDFFQSYLDEAESFGGEGTLYGFPTNKKTANVLVYNKTYFDAKGWKAPTTWTQTAEYSKIIYEETGMPGFSYDTSYADDAFKAMSQQWGSPYIKADGTVDIDNDASRAAIAFYKENMDKGYFTLPAIMPSAGGNNSSNGFVMEECYMFVGAAAGVDYAIPKSDSGQKTFEVGVAPVPQKESGTPVFYSKGEDYCVFSNSTEEERVAAWLLIQFLSGVEENTEWLVNTGNLPIRSSMLELPAFQEFLNSTTPKAAAVQAVLDMQDKMSYERVIPNCAALADECGTMWKSVMIGGAEVDTALAAAAAKVQ